MVDKLIQCIKSKEWTEIDIMKMRLGLQVLIHNIFMVGFILMISECLGIFTYALILLISYGLLKVAAGGIHFKKSSLCLLSTGAFIVCGVWIAKNIKVSLYKVILIYFICMLVLWKIAPKGTDNNPIAPKYYHKLKKDSLLITGLYLLVTIYEFMSGKVKIGSLLLVAVVFETSTLLLGELLCSKGRVN